MVIKGRILYMIFLYRDTSSMSRGTHSKATPPTIEAGPRLIIPPLLGVCGRIGRVSDSLSDSYDKVISTGSEFTCGVSKGD